MCGRYTLTTSAEIIARSFELAAVPACLPRYNIAPSQQALVVRASAAGSDRREAAMLKWGLIPSWATDPAIGNRLINARAETVAEKPSFRAAFRRRRCLVVADGFYEWRAAAAGAKKQPYWIRSTDGAPMGLAAIWESWSRSDTQPVESFAIITTAANELMEPIHARMPVVLASNDYDQWLCTATASRGDTERLQNLLVPCANEALSTVPVGMYVNDPRHDDPACIRASS